MGSRQGLKRQRDGQTAALITDHLEGIAIHAGLVGFDIHLVKSVHDQTRQN
jgi:hypothetical protein